MPELAYSYSTECKQNCPELQSCVAEFVLRQSLEGEDVSMYDVIRERIHQGSLPLQCAEGPVIQAPSALPSRTSERKEIAQGSSIKQDAWGDPVSIRCRQQGRVGMGNIRPA